MSKSKGTWQAELARDLSAPLRPTVDELTALVDTDFLRLGVGSKYPDDRIREHHGRIFDRTYDGDVKKASLRLRQTRERLAARKSQRDSIQADIKATPAADKGSAKEPPPPMPAPEQFTMAFYAILIIVTYWLSSTVVYANIAKTQPDLIASGSVLFWGYFAIPLFFPVLLDISARKFASVTAQQRFDKLILFLAVSGCLLFVLTWSLDSYDAGRPLQAKFEDEFNKAAGAQRAEPTGTEQLRSVLAPYSLFIQLVAEGLMITAFFSALMTIWRTYTRRRPAKRDEIIDMEETLASLVPEIEALEEHETATALAVDEFTQRRADLVNAASAKYAIASSSLGPQPDGTTVRHFRRP